MPLSKLQAFLPEMDDLYASHDPTIADAPRLVRDAVRAIYKTVKPSVAAEIALLCPDMAEAARVWADQGGSGRLALAVRIDERAVRNDDPALHGLSDAVRIATMTVEDACRHPSEALRVVSSLRAAKQIEAERATSPGVLAVLERLVVGWIYFLGWLLRKRPRRSRSPERRSALGP